MEGNTVFRVLCPLVGENAVSEKELQFCFRWQAKVLGLWGACLADPKKEAGGEKRTKEEG